MPDSQKRPGSATLRDVARLAGVHPATVSRALDPDRSHLVSQETRDRIQAAADELDYRINTFARGLRKGSSGMVGVAVADVANPFLPPVLRGIEQELRAEGLSLLIAETHDERATLEEVVEHFRSSRVDALILSAVHDGDEEFVRSVARTTPVVLAVRGFRSGSIPTVRHDDVLGGTVATQHLVDLGHRDIAQLPGRQDISSFSERSKGYSAVLSRSLARDVSTGETATSPTTTEGHRLASLLLAGEVRPTAIFAHNDSMALGAIDAIRDAGYSCPEDISVIGYNDAPFTDHVFPALTTVRLPSQDVGQRAAQLALALLRGESLEGRVEQFPPEIVVRDSTCAPRGD